MIKIRPLNLLHTNYHLKTLSTPQKILRFSPLIEHDLMLDQIIRGVSQKGLWRNLTLHYNQVTLKILFGNPKKLFINKSTPERMNPPPPPALSDKNIAIQTHMYLSLYFWFRVCILYSCYKLLGCFVLFDIIFGFIN